eukprot:5222469-Pyramimonas_sp.AAC.1
MTSDGSFSLHWSRCSPRGAPSGPPHRTDAERRSPLHQKYRRRPAFGSRAAPPRAGGYLPEPFAVLCA